MQSADITTMKTLRNLSQFRTTKPSHFLPTSGMHQSVKIKNGYVFPLKLRLTSIATYKAMPPSYKRFQQVNLITSSAKMDNILSLVGMGN